MVAVADLAAQILSVSCAAMLGGAADSVPVASMLSFREPEAMAAEAVELHERFGIATFKVKVGRDPQLDLAAVRAVRHAMPTATLYVDANRGWSLPQAERVGAELIELGVEAIEEPLDLADDTGRRRLAQLVEHPVGRRRKLPRSGRASRTSSPHRPSVRSVSRSRAPRLTNPQRFWPTAARAASAR